MSKLKLLCSLLLLIGTISTAQANEVEGPDTYQETCSIINGIQVCKMTWCEDYDCDDFAWCFDDTCEDLGIPSWGFDFFCGGSGHAINIIQSPPPFTSVFDYYCLVEPQTNAILECWFQDPANSTPTPPIWVINDLEDHYDWCDTDVTWEVNEDGHSPNAGEAPFTDDASMLELYEETTGYEPPTN